MTRILIAIILLVGAGTVFFMFTEPLFSRPLSIDNDGVIDGGIRALNAKKSQLNIALETASNIEEEIGKLNSKYNNLGRDQLERLNKFLPDQVDNVQLIIDINNIAASHGMTLKSLKLKSENNQDAASVIQRAGSLETGTVSLAFSVSGPYQVLRDFLADLARSLRVVEINNLTFGSADKDFYDYSIDLKTFWLK